MVNDVYDAAKEWARKQRAAKQPPEPTETTNRRPEVVLFYGPDGEVIQRWRIDKEGEREDPVE